MALSAVALQGFEYHRATESNEVFLVPGTPGTTYDQGDLVTVAAGLLAKATANQMPVARVVKQTVVPAATVAFPIPDAKSLIWSGDSQEAATLVAVEPLCPIGSKVLRATFKDHRDDTVVTYDAATRAIACTTGMAADDYPNGALLYVYEGTGAGQVNVVEDYDHTGGAAELLLIVRRPFAIALDATSKFIVLSGEAATNKGVFQLGPIGIADEDELDINDHADNGKFLVFADWRELPRFLRNLTLPIIGAHLFS